MTHVRACVLLAIVTAACGSSSSGDSPAAGGKTGSSKAWPGDACTIFSDADFGALTQMWKIGSTDHDGAVISTCHYILRGDGSQDASSIYVKPYDDFAIEKVIFSAVSYPDIGKDAWKGNNDGRGNSTIGVLLDEYSFMVDRSYNLTDGDLDTLARKAATVIK
ncbi:MAG: hypothetical protein QM756_38865 [Polyangiaceae bacterium]